MKSGKAWCLAIGVFLSASVVPAARGQNPNDDPKSSPRGSSNQQSQAQKQQDSNSPNDQNSPGQDASKQPDQSASNSPKGQYSPDQDASKQPGQSASNSPKGENSQGKAGSKSQNQAGQNQSKNKQGSSAQQQQWNVIYGDQPGQNLGILWPNGGQGWWQDLSSDVWPNLTAADDSVREHLNLPKGQGVVVNAVVPSSGAAQVGIQQNDILLTLGDSPLGNPNDLYDRLKQAGEKPLSLTLLRAGSRVTLPVQPLIRVSLGPVAATTSAREFWIGISVTPLEPVLRAQLRLSPNHKVLVNEVVPDSPAAKAGISRHDIIVALDGKPVSEPSDVAKSVQAKGEKPLILEIIGKGGKSRTVALTPERKKAVDVTYSATLGIRNQSVPYAVDLVRPGIVLDYTTNGKLGYNQSVGSYLTAPLISDSAQKPQDAGSALTGRLDALDSELKELRKVVEALQATASKIVAREKAEAGTTTSEKDQPK